MGCQDGGRFKGREGGKVEEGRDLDGQHRLYGCRWQNPRLHEGRRICQDCFFDTEILSDVKRRIIIESAVSPLRLTLLAKSTGAFLFILSSHQGDEQTSLVVQCVVLSDFERVFNRSFGKRGGNLRLGSNLVGERHGTFHELFLVGEDLTYESPLEGVLSTDGLSSQDHLHGLRLSNSLRKSHSASSSGNNS